MSVPAAAAATPAAAVAVAAGGGGDDECRKMLKQQKQTYRSEKKRVAQELLAALKDPTVVVMADWLKIRGTLRKWTKLFCVLKPGVLLVYKSQKTHKHGIWVGTVLLNTCELIERPSKKDGFCFKLFHPLDQSIWATRGPRGESLGAVTQPLPGTHLICRAASDEAGRCWLDALELSLRCSGLLMRTMTKLSENVAGGGVGSSPAGGGQLHLSPHYGRPALALIPSAPNLASMESASPSAASGGAMASAPALAATASDALLDSMPGIRHMDEVEAERHFLDDSSCASGLGNESNPAPTDDSDADDDAVTMMDIEHARETAYDASAPEEFPSMGSSDNQTEEVADENKNIMWLLMKQVRPGMDLSKVVLPTFILEPRSFLEKLSDYFYHADLIAEASQLHDPYSRMKCMVKYYLSGFYKKPKGLKKPYNPILGEIFRCCWQHDDERQSRTFYVAEQVSHHPPISSFYATNRAAGYNVSGTILAKSKFYGNSLSAIMVGEGRVALLDRGEDYTFTLPYAHCKGLILGTLTMELGGDVLIACEKTRYSAELDFKLKPFFGGAAQMNAIAGRIRLGDKTLATLEGHWDGVITLTDKVTGASEVLWEASAATVQRRLPRYQVPLEQQDEWESQRLWSKVTQAIVDCDQVRATEEKFVLEEGQRRRARDLKERDARHAARLFDYEPASGQWQYKHTDYRPWDDAVDVRQVEHEFAVRTLGRARMPPVRSRSIQSVLRAKADGGIAGAETHSPAVGGSDDEKDTESLCKRSPQPLAADPAELSRSLAAAVQPLRDELRAVARRLPPAATGSDARWALDAPLTVHHALLVLAVALAAHAALTAWIVRRFAP